MTLLRLAERGRIGVDKSKFSRFTVMKVAISVGSKSLSDKWRYLSMVCLESCKTHQESMYIAKSEERFALNF